MKQYYISMLKREGKNVFTCYWYEFTVSRTNKTLFESYNACRETMMIFLKTAESRQYYDVQVMEISNGR